MSGAVAGAEALRRVPLFKGLDPAELERLARQAEPVELEAGDVLIREGDAADALFVVVDGLLEAAKLEGGQPVRLGTYKAGEPLGELALVARRPRSATVRALRPSRLLRIGDATFHELLALPPVAQRMLRTVLARMENQEARLREHAKMAALGTLTAGLLHDLNNPAAAVRSTVRRLGDVLAQWRSLSVDLARLDEDTVSAVEEARARVASRLPAVELDPLERSDRAEALGDELSRHRVERPWEPAAVLTAQGWTVDDVAGLTGGLPQGDAAVVLRWLALDAEVARLLDDAGRGAEHIAEVTRRSKRYSRLDEAPIADTDLHEGLETALALTRAKVGEVRVHREFGAGVPPVEAYPAALNEVWLNLVDNALDALGGKGSLVLRTAAEGSEQVVVEVEDSGPGIPEDVRERMFEPFFTTKPVGQGTGLGLAQVYRIVVQDHGGEVEVDSEPGRTVLRVRLHRRLPDGLGDRSAS